MALKDLLPPYLSTSDTWSSYADAVEKVIKEEVWSRVEDIQSIRDPKVIAKEFLTLFGSMLGFNQKSDLFTEPNYRRILGELAKYYEKSGTRYMGNFMGYLNSARCEVIALWTTDYETFEAFPGGGTIYDGTGPWYVTPHVYLRYNLQSADVGGLQALDKDTLRGLFYELAPIHLVLEGIIELIQIQGEFDLGGVYGIRVRYPATIVKTSLDWGGFYGVRIYLRTPPNAYLAKFPIFNLDVENPQGTSERIAGKIYIYRNDTERFEEIDEAGIVPSFGLSETPQVYTADSTLVYPFYPRWLLGDAVSQGDLRWHVNRSGDTRLVQLVDTTASVPQTWEFEHAEQNGVDATDNNGATWRTVSKYAPLIGAYVEPDTPQEVDDPADHSQWNIPNGIAVYEIADVLIANYPAHRVESVGGGVALSSQPIAITTGTEYTVEFLVRIIDPSVEGKLLITEGTDREFVFNSTQPSIPQPGSGLVGNWNYLPMRGGWVMVWATFTATSTGTEYVHIVPSTGTDIFGAFDIAYAGLGRCGYRFMPIPYKGTRPGDGIWRLRERSGLRNFDNSSTCIVQVESKQSVIGSEIDPHLTVDTDPAEALMRNSDSSPNIESTWPGPAGTVTMPSTTKFQARAIEVSRNVQNNEATAQGVTDSLDIEGSLHLPYVGGQERETHLISGLQGFQSPKIFRTIVCWDFYRTVDFEAAFGPDKHTGLPLIEKVQRPEFVVQSVEEYPNLVILTLHTGEPAEVILNTHLLVSSYSSFGMVHRFTFYGLSPQTAYSFSASATVQSSGSVLFLFAGFYTASPAPAHMKIMLNNPQGSVTRGPGRITGWNGEIFKSYTDSSQPLVVGGSSGYRKWVENYEIEDYAPAWVPGAVLEEGDLVYHTNPNGHCAVLMLLYGGGTLPLSHELVHSESVGSAASDVNGIVYRTKYEYTEERGVLLEPDITNLVDNPTGGPAVFSLSPSHSITTELYPSIIESEPDIPGVYNLGSADTGALHTPPDQFLYAEDSGDVVMVEQTPIPAESFYIVPTMGANGPGVYTALFVVGVVALTLPDVTLFQVQESGVSRGSVSFRWATGEVENADSANWSKVHILGDNRLAVWLNVTLPSTTDIQLHVWPAGETANRTCVVIPYCVNFAAVDFPYQPIPDFATRPGDQLYVPIDIDPEIGPQPGDKPDVNPEGRILMGWSDLGGWPTSERWLMHNESTRPLLYTSAGGLISGNDTDNNNPTVDLSQGGQYIPAVASLDWRKTIRLSVSHPGSGVTIDQEAYSGSLVTGITYPVRVHCEVPVASPVLIRFGALWTQQVGGLQPDWYRSHFGDLAYKRLPT